MTTPCSVGDLVRASSDRQLARMKLFGKRYCDVVKCEAANGDCEACVLNFLRQELDPFDLEMVGVMSPERRDEIAAAQRRVNDSVRLTAIDGYDFAAEIRLEEADDTSIK